MSVFSITGESVFSISEESVFCASLSSEDGIFAESVFGTLLTSETIAIEGKKKIVF